MATEKKAKKAAKVGKAAKRPRPAGRAAAKKGPTSVRVRMYRQGLGDCLLVTFGHDGPEPRHVLIDCGTLGKGVAGNAMGDVVADIAQTTGGHLNALVVTHEHKDHVSGFRGQAEQLGKLTVDEVWLAWTEDPKDPLAEQLERYDRDLDAGLAAVAARLSAHVPRADADDLGVLTGRARLAGLLAGLRDFGADDDDFAETVDKSMDFVRTHYVRKPTYHKPGSPPIEPDWLPGFRIYVLGPPYDKDRLNDLGEHGSDALYHLAATLGPAPAGAAEPAREEGADGMPFDERFRVAGTGPADYRRADEAWRSIDDAALDAAADLALQLDSTTNNTSLVLAIERVADGRVLLFPGDAQQGSWLSWHDPALRWEVADAPGRPPVTVTARDLLARTVFYKVGHHASHNATARGKGLELMGRGDELVAFIPVDRDLALRKRPIWRMPAEVLYRNLLLRCEGRVVRSDTGWAAKSDLIHKRVPKVREIATDDEWQEWRASQEQAEKKKRVAIEKLYVDYVLR